MQTVFPLWEHNGETCALDLADRGGMTLIEVADVLGVTRERVRQIEDSAIEKIRAWFAREKEGSLMFTYQFQLDPKKKLDLRADDRLGFIHHAFVMAGCCVPTATGLRERFVVKANRRSILVEAPKLIDDVWIDQIMRIGGIRSLEAKNALGEVVASR